MQKINQISAYPLQRQVVALENGETFSITIRFISMQYGWFIDELNYNQGEVILQGLRICNSPNMLRQFINKVPFGIACISKNNREPSFIEDFENESSALYLLNASECQLYEEFLRGQ